MHQQHEENNVCLKSKNKGSRSLSFNVEDGLSTSSIAVSQPQDNIGKIAVEAKQVNYEAELDNHQDKTEVEMKDMFIETTLQHPDEGGFDKLKTSVDKSIKRHQQLASTIEENVLVWKNEERFFMEGIIPL